MSETTMSIVFRVGFMIFSVFGFEDAPGRHSPLRMHHRVITRTDRTFTSKTIDDVPDTTPRRRILRPRRPRPAPSNNDLFEDPRLPPVTDRV
jgi:hypothetical protein